MKQIIFATALTLIVSSAFAMDKFLGDTSEYYGSPLLDHSPGVRSDKLGANHDHGDNAFLEFSEHKHAFPVAQVQSSAPGVGDTENHDHGDDVFKNHTPHTH